MVMTMQNMVMEVVSILKDMTMKDMLSSRLFSCRMDMGVVSILVVEVMTMKDMVMGVVSISWRI